MDKIRSGRPSLDESTCDKVAHTLQELSSTSAMGSTSVRKVAAEVDVSKSSVHNLMRKRLQLYPYRLQLLQSLEPGDKPQRLQFAHWLLNNQNILSNILWSDEAYFTLYGVINTHNCRIWSDCKPDTFLTKSLHSPQLCVWMGFSARFGLEPFFFEGTVNADRYLQMLQQHVCPQLAQKRKLSSCIFMQDGAPPHFASRVRDYLLQTFGSNRLISRGCDQFWPPRSPDLNPLDYWFWGWMKARIYHTDKPQSLAELRQKITDFCREVTQEEFAAGVSNIVH